MTAWFDRLPVLRHADGTEFDRAKIVPYAYRHTYVISPGLNLVRDVGHGGWPGTCLTSIRNSFVQVATFAT